MSQFDINDKKLQREVCKTAEGRTILCVYDPNKSLYFLTFADGSKPESPEFQGYFTDPSKADQSALAYITKQNNLRNPVTKAEAFIPNIKPLESAQPKVVAPATNFKKEFNKLKTEVKESLKEREAETPKGIVSLGTKEAEPIFEVGSLKLP